MSTSTQLAAPTAHPAIIAMTQAIRQRTNTQAIEVRRSEASDEHCSCPQLTMTSMITTTAIIGPGNCAKFDGKKCRESQETI